MRSASPQSATLSWLPIVLGNLMPLATVLFFQWGALDVVFLFWLENGVIGLFNVLKMALARPDFQTVGDFVRGFAGKRYQERLSRVPEETQRRWEMPAPSYLLVGVKCFLVPFFVVHYGMFMTVHLMFILFFLGGKPGSDPLEALPSLANFEMALALGFFVAEHGYLFYRDFWRGGEARQSHPAKLMFAPYPRVVVMHLAILFGGFLVVFLSLPQTMAVVLVVLKIALELAQPRVAPVPAG